jgi:hypothetical protein
MKHLLPRACVFPLAVTASLLAIAQSLPVFGTARFGQAESEFKSTKLCAVLLALRFAQATAVTLFCPLTYTNRPILERRYG